MESVLEIPDAAFEPRQPTAINKPVLLSHGTLQVRNIKDRAASMRNSSGSNACAKDRAQSLCVAE